MVGYPLISYLVARDCSTVASTLAMTTSLSSLSLLAANSYSGANFLQCPHHGA